MVGIDSVTLFANHQLLGYSPHPVTVYIRGPIKGYIEPYYTYYPTVTEGGAVSKIAPLMNHGLPRSDIHMMGHPESQIFGGPNRLGTMFGPINKKIYIYIYYSIHIPKASHVITCCNVTVDYITFPKYNLF